ncbi:latrophilin receptor-like protein A [Mytilus californianus]|uniref:latrophilin receptor-like protein A n=1 Tax=Mytilus californianus TaxID=6549 RepID=UPI002246057B|nr:latrophilin receptor-like protein A [Mytilus californianus]
MSSGKARICLETFRKMLTEDTPEGRNVWGIIEVTCSCTSLVCLVVTFITYCVFPTLRTLPGKINMCLVFATFHGHGLFYFILYGSRSHVACMIIGTLVHYFWLVIFGCLNVCSFHMYQAFTSEKVVVFSEVKRLCIYIAYSYGVPSIIVSSNVLFTYIYSDKKTFGYVGDICFLNHQLSFVFSFIVPITLVCCSNLFFFTTTVMQIVKRPKLENERQIKLNRLHVAIYLKLFSVTGISWLLQIIDTFLPMSVFSRIVSGLNGLQGIFIFWSFICNKRVFNLYLKSCRSNLNKTVKEIAGKSEQETNSIELTTSKQEE